MAALFKTDKCSLCGKPLTPDAPINILHIWLKREDVCDNCRKEIEDFLDQRRRKASL